MPAKTKPKGRTSLMLDRDDYKLLDEVRRANGWSVGEATRRAIHALFALDAHLESRAKQQKGQLRNLIQRVRREVDPALLVHAKPMGKVQTSSGEWGVRVDDLTFLEEDDRLFARREVDDRVEVFEVVDGRLVLRYPTVPSPDDAVLIELSQN
jgi:hypothetical protein